MTKQEMAILDDLAWYLSSQLDECPLIFELRGEYQEYLERKFKEYNRG